MHTFTAVMPVFNQPEMTHTAITSFLQHSHHTCKLIVIDNASLKPTQSMLKQFECHPQVELIFNNDNKGFPGAVNQAMLLNQSPFFAILNSDLIFTPEWDAPLISLLQQDALIGIAGPVTNHVRKGSQLENVTLHHPMECMEYAKKRSQRDAHFTASLSGFCWIQKSELMHRMGLFDEYFSPGNFEDNDYCVRTLFGGYKLMVQPHSFIYHHGNASFQTLNQSYVDIIARNQAYYFSKSLAAFKETPSPKIALELAIKFCEKEDYTTAWIYLEHAFKNDISFLHDVIPSTSPISFSKSNLPHLTDIAISAFAKDSSFVFLILALCVLGALNHDTKVLLTLYKTLASYSHSTHLNQFISQQLGQLNTIKS